MDIAVAVLTRDRPAGLVTLITALHALASGDHRIIYIVRYDDDDEATAKLALPCLGDGAAFFVWPICKPRAPTLGEAWTDCLPFLNMHDPDWRAITLICDDVIPMAVGWDRGVAALIGDRQMLACSWCEINDPTNANYHILSRRWVDAQGYVLSDWFPFWFADTWLNQVYEFATGEPLAIVSDMVLAGRRGTTSGMRDLGFWVEFWNATLPLRRSEGTQMAAKLGLPLADQTPIVEKFERLGRMWNIPAIEAARQGPQAQQPPSERYLTAKRRAEAWMAENAG